MSLIYLRNLANRVRYYFILPLFIFENASYREFCFDYRCKPMALNKVKNVDVYFELHL